MIQSSQATAASLVSDASIAGPQPCNALETNKQKKRRRTATSKIALKVRPLRATDERVSDLRKKNGDAALVSHARIGV